MEFSMKRQIVGVEIPLTSGVSRARQTFNVNTYEKT